jgi:DNA-binding response OmpR family regulator
MEYFKILVVHRQVDFLEAVKSILERFEFELRQYDCGIDGLQAAKLEHFDLILCGTDLPLITGFEMIRAIRNLSRNCFTPVIFVSDQLNPEHESLASQLNAIGLSGAKNLHANLTYLIDTSAALQVIHSEVIQ